jgi:hypothetical protein
MFELHVVVVGIVMFNILELIMEIVPNYPTAWWLGWADVSWLLIWRNHGKRIPFLCQALDLAGVAASSSAGWARRQ